MIAAGANATLAVLLFFAAFLGCISTRFHECLGGLCAPLVDDSGLQHHRYLGIQQARFIADSIGCCSCPCRWLDIASHPWSSSPIYAVTCHAGQRSSLLVASHLLSAVLCFEYLACWIHSACPGNTHWRYRIFEFWRPGNLWAVQRVRQCTGPNRVLPVDEKSGAPPCTRFTFFLVLGVFVLFVTRQNLISLVVEAFAVYCMVVRKVSGVRVFLFALGLLLAFGTLGNFRTGSDIADLAAIRHQYLWVPSAFVWLFAYCYFCILNLDNVVAATLQPAFDGSSLASLLPSFLRPESVAGVDVVEVSSFATTSFISPLVHDFGIAGTAVVLFGFLRGCAWICAPAWPRWFLSGRYRLMPFCISASPSLFS